MAVKAETLRAQRKRLDLVTMQVKGFPMSLKQTLIAEADQRGTSMNDVAVELLASHFKERWVSSEKASPVAPTDNSDMVEFRMPRRLRDKIRIYAATYELSRRAVIIAVLTRTMR